jgi:endonuclease YncB( thermonuclease family)
LFPAITLNGYKLAVDKILPSSSRSIKVISGSLLIFLFLGAFCPLDGKAEDKILIARVVKVIDGDSLLVVTQSQTVQVRLWGIDCPEYRQAYSKAAKLFSQELVLGKTVTLQSKDWDKYGRMVALVRIEGGRTLNQELIKAGYAWVHIYYCKEVICDSWYTFEEEARMRHDGLWQQQSPVPPWEWKRMKKKH